MRFWAGLGAAGLGLVLPLAASAQTPAWLSGVYVGAGVGWNIAEDSDIDGTGLNGDIEFDDGYAGFVTIGGQLWFFRGEGEFGYRNNDVDSVSGIPGGGSGEAKVKSYMGNVLFDIPTGTPWTPYIGAGIGAAWVRMEGNLPAAGVTVDDSERALAYQGILGVTYRMSPNVGIFADYRYFDTEENQFTASNGTQFDTDYTAHTLTVGLRYTFGTVTPAPAPAPQPVAQPKPAPAQAPAPAPAPVQVPRTYLVFFDFDKSDIRPEARRIIETAAANRKTANVTRLEVTGHADRSGPDRYNERLSMRRAEAVRAELVGLGVPANEIAIFAKGEREPLVQTADGVREPQNRRVEIVLK